MLPKAVICLLYIYVISFSKSVAESPWAWRCVEDGQDSRCVKQRALENSDQMSLERCKLTCSPFGSIFPRPKSARLGKTVVNFLPNRISLSYTECNMKICALLSKAMTIFEDIVSKYHPEANEGSIYWRGPWVNATKDNQLVVDFDVPGLSDHLRLHVLESYTLNITRLGNKIVAKIQAPTFFGARHALETLSQLIAYDEEMNALQIVASAMIKDRPEFSYRGVLLDTARSFIPVKDIKRTLDGMSYNKLNTFHWHITDSQSFPLILTSVPQMAKFGASSPKNTYSPQDVRDIVEYARLRGIRVLPEFDAPAHVGHGWQWGVENGLGKLVVCLDKQPWTSYCAGPPCGQLNLANKNIYKVIEKILKEMVDMFSPVEFFHYGGDEIFTNCWNTSTEMTDYMDLNGLGRTDQSYYKEWAKFQENVRVLLKKGNGNIEIPGIIWTSTLTSKENVDKYLGKDKYIIQIWTKKDDAVIGELLRGGYNVIFSNYDALYLDCGFASWVSSGNNWCSPYKGWQGIYDNDIMNISDTMAGVGRYNKSQILGAEVTLWTEQVDRYTLDSKMWPRASAHAERMWSNPVEDYAKAESRVNEQRERLVSRGFAPERLRPEWCRQNEGGCPIPKKTDEENQHI